MYPNKAPALSTTSFLLLAVIAMAAAAFYRLPLLDERPMHTDEAILAYKTADFQSTGHFNYDPKDYHGPGLHYAAILWSKLAFWGAPDTWHADQLRTVTAVCGLLLILTTLLLTDVLGRGGMVAAMLLAAVSPMQVYYSRYYIMETPLVMLIMISLVSFWRYSQGGGRLWLLLGGIATGLQHATKETFILNVAAGFVAWFIAKQLFGPFEPRRSGFSMGPSKQRPGKPMLWVLIPAAIVSVAMYSGGFHDWDAVQNSVTTYANYLERSGGAGHEKPWHYYLTLLTWRSDGGLNWTEGLIVGLALIGMGHGLAGNHQKNGPRQAFLVFLSLYALLLIGGYSVLAYKTPWSILSAQHALILLAGYGTRVLASVFSKGIMRIGFRIAFGLGLYHLCFQTNLAIHRYAADARNPWTYSHTVQAFPRLLLQVSELQRIEPAPMSILVVNKDLGWPMRWYWRTNANARYESSVPEAELTASVIICDADALPAVQAKLGTRPYHNQGFYGLRPNENLIMLVEQSLWTRYENAQKDAAVTP
jgi:uncharacterized protein (TIGR03663 family)